MRRDGLEHLPATVTAEYSVTFQRPTPVDGSVHVRVLEAGSDRATVETTVEAGGQVCATGRGTFVAVRQGHPACHRW